MVDLNKGATVELVKALSDDIRTLPNNTKVSSAGMMGRIMAEKIGLRTVTGKNKLDVYGVTEKLANGEYNTASGGYYVIPIQLKPNTAYSVSATTHAPTANIFISTLEAVNSSYGNAVSIGSAEWARGRVLTTGEDGFLYIGTNNLPAAINELPDVKAQIEEGSEQTSWESYTTYYESIISDHTTQINNNATTISAVATDLNAIKKAPKKETTIKPLFIELAANFNWVSSNEVSAFSSNDERFSDGSPDGNNAFFKITGSAGNDYVTVVSGGNAQISDLPTDTVWGAILSYDNGVTFEPCNAQYRNASTISVYPPLKKNITVGEIGNIKTGIHLSKRGYKGYAEVAFSQNPKWCEKGKPIAKYRVDDETVPFTVYGGQVASGVSTVNMSNKFLCRYGTNFYRLSYYSMWQPHTTETGISWTVTLDGKNGYLELFVGGYNDNYIDYPIGQEIHIDVYFDGVLMESRIKSNQITERICVDYEGVQSATLKIYSNKWDATEGTYGFSIGGITWWENELEYDRNDCIFKDFATVSQMFDSWGVFHESESAKELSRLQREKCGVYIPWENHSRGSQTSAWGKGWFYENVARYNPAYMIIDFCINDNNSTKTAGFPETVTGSDGTVYNNIITKEIYISNMTDLCKMAIANGIRPVIFGCCLHSNIEWYHALVDAQENVVY